ncbi:MAG: MoxR-like ATPase [Capsulimonas sp.]|nr:MoxR-like ATPase [Capsulimonas sp.]
MTMEIERSTTPGAAAALTQSEFAEIVSRVEENLGLVIRGKSESIRLVMVALLAGGHVLLEDVPGTGKTTLAKSLACSISGIFRRIQFTPDLLPADITGTSFYRPADGTFEFREGPVFANVLLADEINRTSPRTQSALLEVMSENQITIEGRRKDLPQPFFVIATQNPTEFHGTYPLPEAQLDRFAVRVTMGYPDIAHEMEILTSHHDHDPFDALKPRVNGEDILAMQERVKTIKFDTSVAEYVLKIVDATRKDARLRLGVSPRGSLTLYRTAQARAAIDGRDFVLPEDVRALAIPVLAHRIMLDTKAKYGGVQPNQVIEEILETVAAPR